MSKITNNGITWSCTGAL